MLETTILGTAQATDEQACYWAPAPTYHTKIVKFVQQIIDR